MTNKVQKEETPNPYNQRKDWHVEDDKPFVSSNSMFFEEPQNKLFKSDDITEVEAEGSVNTEELESKKDTPYKRPNYKKRYDDLKKHYDSKLNEFKSREQDAVKPKINLAALLGKANSKLSAERHMSMSNKITMASLLANLFRLKIHKKVTVH